MLIDLVKIPISKWALKSISDRNGNKRSNRVLWHQQIGVFPQETWCAETGRSGEPVRTDEALEREAGFDYHLRKPSAFRIFAICCKKWPVNYFC
jgi:hypothetical protein